MCDECIYADGMKAITAHFLATYAQLVTDRITAKLEETLGSGGEAPAAIIHLGSVTGISILELSEVLGLSHAGAVRLVDRLVEDGMIDRSRGRDGRSRILTLTAKGVAMRNTLLSERLAAAESVMLGITDQEWDTLRDLLARILKIAPGGIVDRKRMCRLCDPGLCRFHFNLKSTASQDGTAPEEDSCYLFVTE